MTITAKVIAHSRAEGVPDLYTLELHYPRFIHAELLTHRMFARNASSSRAIPTDRVIQAVDDDPARPISWGMNQPGMVAGEEVIYPKEAAMAWDAACNDALRHAANMARNLNVHKQHVNRLLEPFSHITVVVTATEWENFFKLREHSSAQPEMQELARKMREAMEASTPELLGWNNWHLPYATMESEILSDRIASSVAGCARVSYAMHDSTERTLAKDLELAKRLDRMGHLSPMEHQATPVDLSDELFQEGVTHIDRYGKQWSGPLQGWLQYRHWR